MRPASWGHSPRTCVLLTASAYLKEIEFDFPSSPRPHKLIVSHMLTITKNIMRVRAYGREWDNLNMPFFKVFPSSWVYYFSIIWMIMQFFNDWLVKMKFWNKVILMHQSIFKWKLWEWANTNLHKKCILTQQNRRTLQVGKLTSFTCTVVYRLYFINWYM